jgi:anaerobic magnesium-protoporphyrin IX monomethyl ester cyclase
MPRGRGASSDPVDVVLLSPPQEIVFNPAHHPRVIERSGAYPPLGLAHLAGTLEAEKISAAIWDLGAMPIAPDELAARLRLARPKVVGVGAMTLALGSVSKLVALVRQTLPGTTLVLGGPCMEDYPREVLTRLAEVDVAVVGEGELTFRDVVSRSLAGQDLQGIEGTVYRRDGEAVVAAARAPLKELDQLPRPAYHLINFERYAPVISRGAGFATMYTMRGCPYNCRYCHRQSWLTTVRHHSAERVVSDVEHLVGDLGVKEIKFYDETFTLGRRRVLEICRQMSQRSRGVPWEIRTRPELLDEELTRELARSGCYRICLGIEGGSQERLDRMGRTTRIADIRNAFRWAHDNRLSTLAFFMIGYPGDARRDYEDVLRLAKQVNPTWIVVAVTSAYANTEVYRQLLESGRLERDVWRDYTLGQLDQIDKADLTFDGLDYSREGLDAMLSRLYWRFYLRPGQIARVLREIRSRRQLVNFGRMALAFAESALKPR